MSTTVTQLRRFTHRAIKAVTDAIEGFRFNSAVARFHEFAAALRNHPAAGASPAAAEPAIQQPAINQAATAQN